MRRISALSVALLATMSAVAKYPAVVSKTIYTNQPILSQAMPANVSMARADRMDTKEKESQCGGSFDLTGVYSQTTESQGMRDYFLPFAGKTSLIAGGTGSAAYTNSGAGGVLPGVDLVSNYFGVLTGPVADAGDLVDNLTFQSSLAFAPRQTTAGVGVKWQQRFWGCCKEWWFRINVPILHVKNDLRMVETVTNPGNYPLTSPTTAPAVPAGSNGVLNMTAAFANPALLYGKIDGAQSKWGVADMEVMIGRDLIDEDDLQLNGYAGVVLPTGNKPNPEYLFPAVVGNNKHVGVMLGSSVVMTFHETDCYTLSVRNDSNAVYLFSNTQTRMLDLMNRPWSRYLWLTKQASFACGSSNDIIFGTNTFLGANILTQEVTVNPHAAFTFNTALNYRRENGLEAEVGFNLYTRQAEEIKLKNPFTNTDGYMVPEINDAVDNCGTGPFYSAPATINNAMLGIADQDYQNTSIAVLLTESMLDLNSASSPAIFQNTFYGNVCMNWDKWKFPGYFGVGGGYTVNGDNSGADHWAVWGKAGISF